MFVLYNSPEIVEEKISPPVKPKLNKIKENLEEKKKIAQRSKLQVSLFRHKEMLKKDILKKRALLEKELQIQIQVVTKKFQ